jgi:HPt (histidine-containing phosphotransfer) domain-containing protein
MPDEIDRTTFNELKQMSGTDFIGELIDTFLEDAPKLIAEMKSSLSEGNAETFRRAAHSLKSNAATFGARHLSGLARDLESLGRDGRLSGAGPLLEDVEKALRAMAAELQSLK